MKFLGWVWGDRTIIWYTEYPAHCNISNNLSHFWPSSICTWFYSCMFGRAHLFLVSYAIYMYLPIMFMVASLVPKKYRRVGTKSALTYHSKYNKPGIVSIILGTYCMYIIQPSNWYINPASMLTSHKILLPTVWISISSTKHNSRLPGAGFHAYLFLKSSDIGALPVLTLCDK